MLLACEKLRGALGPVAADKGGNLSWTELAAAAQGDANGFSPSKVRRKDLLHLCAKNSSQGAACAGGRAPIGHKIKRDRNV